MSSDENDFDDYFKQFKRAFDNDFGFSRQFKKAADKILLQNLAEMKDHEYRETESDVLADSKGADRTVKVPPIAIGVRVRRENYLHFADFTIDTKEWGNGTYPSFYLYGYGNEETKTFSFYMLWHHKEFIKLAKKGKIKSSVERNQKHSTVHFLAFSLKDIFDKCAVLDFGGTPDAIRQILGDVDNKNSKLGDYV